MSERYFCTSWNPLEQMALMGFSLPGNDAGLQGLNTSVTAMVTGVAPASPRP